MSAPVLLSNAFDVQQFLIRKSNGDEFATVTTEEDEEEAVFSGDSLPGDEDPFCFYFVKQFSYNDPQIKTKIDEADNEIYLCNYDRIHLANKLKSKRAERLSLVASMENLMSTLDEYNTVKNEQEVIAEKIHSLSEILSEVKIEIESLDARMASVLEQRDKAFERIKFLRIQRDKGNAAFFQSRVVMKKAIELATSVNVRDLEELSTSEVDKFMSRWNNDKAFRKDYKNRLLPSLDERNLSRDGRIIDPEGDETLATKVIKLKRLSSEEESDDAMEYEKLKKIDEDTLKAKKREEQLEKARLAMERKRKLHVKAAAKAAIRVKKEAEKKLKELEKRAKKKTLFNSSSSSSSDLDRTMESVTELEKEKLLKRRSVRSFRFRHHGKGNETVPRAILKRRKAHRLWIWTVSSGVLALAFALVLMFFYVR